MIYQEVHSRSRIPTININTVLHYVLLKPAALESNSKLILAGATWIPGT